MSASTRGGNGFFRGALQSTIGTMLLALLAMAAPLGAQAAPHPTHGRRKRRAHVHARDNHAFRIPEVPAKVPLEALLPCGIGATPATVGQRGLASAFPYRGSSAAVSAGSPDFCGQTIPRFNSLFRTPRLPQSLALFPPAPPAAENDTDRFPGDFLAGGLPRSRRRPDSNRYIYYQNRLEASLESGYLPVNIPFVFEFLQGDNYHRNPRDYTLVPIILSLRWQLDDLGGPWFLRGNWEATFGGSATLIPSGPETRYFAFITGIRRNFVPRNWRFAPYIGLRGGVGDINAKEPYGFRFAQGQDLTFTLMVDAGVRYNFDSRYAFEAGVTYMHISNAYLSEPKYPNYGINVYGPMFALDMRLGKAPRPRESE